MASRVRSYNHEGLSALSVSLTGGKSIVVLTVNASTSHYVTGVALAGQALTRVYNSTLQYQVCSVYFLNYTATGSASLTFSGAGSTSRQFVIIANTPLTFVRSAHAYDRILEQNQSVDVWATIASTYMRSGDLCFGFGRGTRGSPYINYTTSMSTWTLAHGLMVEDGRHEYLMHYKNSTGTQERVGGRITYGSWCALIAAFREYVDPDPPPVPPEEEVSNKNIRWFL